MSDDDDESISSPLENITPRLTPSNNNPQTSTSELAIGISRWIEASHNFLYVELSSLILMFAIVADWYANAWMKYALSVACISLGICVMLQTMEFLIPGFLETGIFPGRGDGEKHSVEKCCSVFLLIWWIIGTGIITFKAPFITTSNGWFGAWGGLLSTIHWSIGLKSSTYKNKPEPIKYLINLAGCSLLLVFASIPPIRGKWEHWGGAGFSIAAGALTMIACAYLIMMYDDVPRDVMKLTVCLKFVLWACVAGVCTFHGPFLVTNNGYFACWLGLLSTLRLGIFEMNDGSPR